MEIYFSDEGSSYEGCPWFFETITILSKGLHIIQNNLHSHQAQPIWDLWLNYPTVAFNDYDPVAYWRFIPHYIGARPISFALIARFSWFTIV